MAVLPTVCMMHAMQGLLDYGLEDKGGHCGKAVSRVVRRRGMHPAWPRLQQESVLVRAASTMARRKQHAAILMTVVPMTAAPMTAVLLMAVPMTAVLLIRAVSANSTQLY